MCSAVGLAQGNRNLGNGGLAVGIEKFGAVGDDRTVLLLGAGKESGYIYEGDQWNVEGIAEAHEARCLAGCVDVQHAGEHLGLVGHDADAASAEVGESHDYVLGEVLVDLEEVAVIHDGADDLVHVVCLVGVVRDYLVENVGHAVDRVYCGAFRSRLHVVLGYVA